jgi:hypothetical protein
MILSCAIRQILENLYPQEFDQLPEGHCFESNKPGEKGINKGTESASVPFTCVEVV